MERLEGLVTSLAAGHITRREFVWQATLLGLSTASIGSLLAACQAGGSQQAGGKPRLIVAVDTDIDDLDPNNFKSDAAYEAVIQTYEMPVDNRLKQGDNGVLEATPDLDPTLASSYQVSPDGLKYTFKVRPGVKFSNGSPVTAKSFDYGYKRALLGPGYAALLMNMLTVKDPSQLRVVDDMTYEITLEKPNPMANKLFPLTVLDVMDPDTAQKNATPDDKYATKFFKTNIVGTGPYVKGDVWQSGSQYLFNPNPSYWNKSKVKNSGVLMKYIPSAEDRLLLLRRGDIDLAFGLPAKSLNQLQSVKDVKLNRFASRNTNYMVLNSRQKPFDDVRVRQAIQYAIPYDTLVKNVLYGFGRPLKSIVAAGMPTSEDSTWSYANNMDKAKSLLAEANLGSGFRTSLGVSVSRAEDADAAVWIQSSLAKLGIQVDINKLSDADFRAKQQADQLPMFIEYWYSWVNDPFYQLYWLMLSSNKFTNVARYSDPEMDNVISTGMYNTNESQRAQLSRRAQEIFDRDVPYILLYQRDFVLAGRSNVQGINVYPDQYLRFWQLTKS